MELIKGDGSIDGSYSSTDCMETFFPIIMITIDAILLTTFMVEKNFHAKRQIPLHPQKNKV